MSSSAAPAVLHGIITGRKPYRMLDEISVANGATRLRALFLLPFLCFLMGALTLVYELAADNVEDRDVRDMTWDYRVTLAASTAFHAYFRQAYWSTYYAMNDAKEVYREVVVAAEDRPVVLALHGANCHRTVQVPCLASKPEHRAAAAGPLNLGTDVGVWAVGNGRAFKRNATWYGLLDDGLASVPSQYPNASSLAAAYDTGLAELAEMRRSAGVPNAAVNGLSCAADATGQTCGWTAAQWSTWATVAYTNLTTATCNTEVDVCAQVSAALRLAAASDAAAGKVAVRVVTGSWTKDNVLLKSLAGTLPVVTVVSNNGNGSDILDAQTAAALIWYPLTDATSADNTAYVPPAAAAALVSAAAATMGVRKVGYAAPGDADTAYHGLRGGVTVNGARADLETAFETAGAWKTSKLFDPIFRVFWPWPAACGDTGYNVTVASDEVTVTGFPAFNARDDTAATVPVVVLGTTENVPAYASSCDFDGAAAGAAAEAISCTVAALTGLRVDVAFTPVAGSEFGAWRVAKVEPRYGGAGGSEVGDHFAGTETGAVAFFGVNSTRVVAVTLRDAGAPEAFAAPALGTAAAMYSAMALFLSGILVLSSLPFLMRKVAFNVAVNEGRPPPGWRSMIRYRGW